MVIGCGCYFDDVSCGWAVVQHADGRVCEFWSRSTTLNLLLFRVFCLSLCAPTGALIEQIESDGECTALDPMESALHGIR